MLAIQKGRSKPVRTSCRRSTKLKSFSWSLTLLLREPLSQISDGDAGNANGLQAAASAGSYRNGRARDFQKIGEEINAAIIGAAFDRRRGQGEFDGIAKLARDGVLLGPGMDFDLKGDAVFIFADRNHGFGRSPKMAVPIRTQVEPSSIAISKSCDMPMESSLISMAGKWRAAIRSRSSRRRRKYGRDDSASSPNGGMAMRPRTRR